MTVGVMRRAGFGDGTRRLWGLIAATCLVSTFAHHTADAQDAGEPVEGEVAASQDVPPNVAQARDFFFKGAEHVRTARWSEAIAAFRRSAELHPHATTTFNIAACERALGHYTRAWLTYERALSEHGRRGGELSPALEQEARERRQEMDALLARVELFLMPAAVDIAVDGAPLSPRTDDQGRRFHVAGLEALGPGKRAPGARFEVVLDPGAHVLTISREGWADAVVNRSFNRGTRTELRLELERLPASLEIESNVPGAIVTLNGSDVGLVPVHLSRPQGMYDVVVRTSGYDPYEATIRLNAGQQANLRAVLVEESQALTGKWWFWVGAAAVVAGGATVTYALTRPEPNPPPYDGGSTGWVVAPKAFCF